MPKRHDPITALATLCIVIFMACAVMAACAAGQTRNILDPVPPANAAPAPERYEYQVVLCADYPDQAVLNRLGAQGYRVVAAYTKPYISPTLILERRR
jgi:hypothetical protein